MDPAARYTSVVRYLRRSVTIHVLYSAKVSANSFTQEMGAARSSRTSKGTPPTTLTKTVRRMCVVQHALFVIESQAAFHDEDSVRFVSEVAHVLKTLSQDGILMHTISVNWVSHTG